MEEGGVPVSLSGDPEDVRSPEPAQCSSALPYSPRPLIRLVDVSSSSRSVPCTPHLAHLLTPSALLSPAPSHVSSSAGSSQEEIRPGGGDRFLFPPAGAPPPPSPHAWHSSVWHTFMTGESDWHALMTGAW